MKYLFILLVALALLTACRDHKQNTLAKQDNIKTVNSDDLTMNLAIERAKQTFGQFDTAFKNGHFDTSQFSLKVRFGLENGGEHIWTYGISFENNAYYGIIDENAVQATNIKRGDKVKITESNLSDWMYPDNGILRGGYTIRVFRNKMTLEERKSFDSSLELKIID